MLAVLCVFQPTQDRNVTQLFQLPRIKPVTKLYMCANTNGKPNVCKKMYETTRVYARELCTAAFCSGSWTNEHKRIARSAGQRALVVSVGRVGRCMKEGVDGLSWEVSVLTIRLQTDCCVCS